MGPAEATAGASGVDWVRVENVVALCQHAQAVPPETKAALKGALRTTSARLILMTLTVLDSVALNVGADVRASLASKGWMRLLTGLAAAEAPCVAPAVAQLLANWRLMFMCAHSLLLAANCLMKLLPAYTRFPLAYRNLHTGRLVIA